VRQQLVEEADLEVARLGPERGGQVLGRIASLLDCEEDGREALGEAVRSPSVTS
jgi:hypothetical protein